MSINLQISDFAKEFNFDDIRPYYDDEVREVADKLITDPIFMQLVNYLWPDMTLDQVKLKINKVQSSPDFQMEFMHGAIRKIIEFSSQGLTSSGFEQLDPNKNYLFVSNHRDILLDAAILQVLLVEHGFSTSEISFGSNLKEKGFITEFVKLNRMYTVLREGNSKELYEISRKLSAYIRHTIVDKKTSTWIAQRNGRTKDGHDFTQTGLLKMLNISGNKTFVENFAQLNIVPLTISYEYEPCDGLKAEELYLSSLHTRYTKAQGEDLNSIVSGIQQAKGKIHLTVGKPVDHDDIAFAAKHESENDKIKALAMLLDREIYKNYKINPINYVAADLLEKSGERQMKYSPMQKQAFIKYAEEKITKIGGEHDVLMQIFLKIYANPLLNYGE
jgi:hypothetical protein